MLLVIYMIKYKDKIEGIAISMPIIDSKNGYARTGDGLDIMMINIY